MMFTWLNIYKISKSIFFKPYNFFYVDPDKDQGPRQGWEYVTNSLYLLDKSPL